MSERLRLELEESKAERTQLRDRLSMVMPMIQKDLSLISFVPKWSGAETAVPLEEILSSIEGAARMGRWTEEDCVQIASLHLLDPAKTFYNSNLELHAADMTWERFKGGSVKDVHPDQHYFTKLQTAKQEINEGPQEFADCCQNLAQKVTGRDNDPVAQWIHHENAERMCLASFTAGLNGMVGQHVRIANPQSVQQAWTTALAVTEAMWQEKASEIFFAKTPDENLGQACDSHTGIRQRKPSRKAQRRGRHEVLRMWRSGAFGTRMSHKVKKGKNSRAWRDSRSPSERSELNPGNPHENRRASSFFLSASEMAADFHTASLRLCQGKPTVRVKIHGVNREFVVSGSGVSLIKSGICHGWVRPSRTTSFGMTEDALSIRGEQDVQFCLVNWNYQHTVCVCPLLTNTDGILGMDFLAEMYVSIDVGEHVFRSTSNTKMRYFEP